MLKLPVDEYKTGGFYVFGQKLWSWKGWITHLGDDVAVPAGAEVRVIGPGKVVVAETRPGSAEKRNWGGVIVLKHNFQFSKANFQTFYSLYGHLKNLEIKVGDEVETGQKLGVVAEGLTPENGWWKEPHLHFAIYAGPWREGVMLPGYARWWEWGRTRRKWWHDPRKFIDTYNKSDER